MFVGNNAFRFCSSLTQVVLTDGLNVLGVYMFYMGGANTLLSSITIPSSVIIIGRYYYAYYQYYCLLGITNISIPSKL